MADYDASCRGYMHMNIGLFENKLTFGEDETEYYLGEALLGFVNADLRVLLNRAEYFAGDFASVHPYFKNCDTIWRDEFLKNLKSAEKSSMPDLQKLIAMQDAYLSFLESLYNKNGSIDEKHVEALIGDNPVLRQNRCIYRMQLLKSGKVDYFVSSLEECLLIECLEVLRRRILLKQCKNCGRLFVARRSNMDYCLRPYTPDGRTCSEVGYTQTFAKNVKNDELLLAYTRAYKAHYARMTKPRKKSANLTREQFESWYQEAKSKLDLARAGVLDAEEFKNWLKI